MDQCNDKLCKITKFQAKLIDDYIGSSSFFKAVKEILAARVMRIAGGCLYSIGGVTFFVC
jgi:hypothetical protein